MRRPLTVEWMLLTTVVLWSLNLTVTRYILTHGFHPLAYATVRYGTAALIFVGIALVAERSLRLRRADLGLVALAALCLWLNQLVVRLRAREDERLDDRPDPRCDADLRGADRDRVRAGAAVAEVLDRSCHLVRRRRSRRRRLACRLLGRPARQPARRSRLRPPGPRYSVAIAPLMERYSASRISAVVLSLGWVLIALVGFPQTADQDYALGLEGVGCCSASRRSDRSW